MTTNADWFKEQVAKYIENCADQDSEFKKKAHEWFKANKSGGITGPYCPDYIFGGLVGRFALDEGNPVYAKEVPDAKNVGDEADYKHQEKSDAPRAFKN